MDNKYEIVIKQLMHERNELRKYIIGICELLAINTGSSVLGANCIEFYAVLFSTAKNKIGKLQSYTRAIDEIKKIANKQRKFDLTGRTPLAPVINEVGGDFIDILDIINEVKDN